MSEKSSIRAVMELGLLKVACVFVTGLFVLPFADAQTNGGAVLTLDQALVLAKANNRDLKLFGLDVGKQREALGEARTHLYPRFDTSVLAAELLTPLDFTIKKGQFGTFSGTGPIPGSNTNLHTPARPIAIASVTATQPLTQLIRIHLFIADQRLKVDAAQLSFDQREQKLTDDVRHSYYQVLQSQIQYESQQSVVKYLEELLQLTDRRFSQHAALEADRLSVKAEVAKATYQLTTIEDTLADNKEALNHLLGRRVQTEFSVELVPATLPEQEDLPAARATALERRPEMKLAANRVRQADLATRSEKTGRSAIRFARLPLQSSRQDCPSKTPANRFLSKSIRILDIYEKRVRTLLSQKQSVTPRLRDCGIKRKHTLSNRFCSPTC